MTPRIEPPNPRMTSAVGERLRQCYAVMAESAEWRPLAGSGSLGAEAAEYARFRWREEQRGSFDLGLVADQDRGVVTFIIEAARAARTGHRQAALDLLELARIEMELADEQVAA